MRLHRGVFAPRMDPPAWERNAIAACLAGPPATLLSHASAARALGLGAVIDNHGVLDVTIPHGSEMKLQGDRAHRTRYLHRTDRTQIGRLPVTNVARTLIDLGGVLSTRTLQNALDDALTRRLTTPSLVIAAISRNRHRRRAGSDRLELALLPWLGTSLESPAEAEVLRILSVQGLPAPVTQVTEIVGGGARFRLDFAWIDQRVALEIDGFQFHDGPDRFVSDRYRANLLTDAGWHVLRTTLSELTQDPNPLCRALRRLLLGNSVAFGYRPDDNLGGITGA